VRFLSDQWFDEATDALEEIRLERAGSCRLNFAAEAARWHLEIESGRVTSFGLGHLDRADAELRWSMDDARDIVLRQLRGDQAMERTKVETLTIDGYYVGLPAPYDLRYRPELDGLPFIPGATLTVQYVFRGSPFGAVHHVLRFVDGRCVDGAVGFVADPTVTVDVTYRAMALVRAGEITILDALEGGRVDGPVGALGILAGITEDVHFHAAELATGRHAIALSALGALDSDERYADLMLTLASATRS
jgi:hypothetical protein